ncbi:MAG: VCBS repeat-containing protein, partial [bacterium]|nr:VCBS repeat-containing protein [bacterium]
MSQPSKHPLTALGLVALLVLARLPVLASDAPNTVESRIEAAGRSLEGRDAGLESTTALLAPQAGAVPLETMPFWTTSEQDIYSTGMIWRDCNRDGYVDVFFSNGNDIVRAANNIYLSHSGLLPPAASWYSTDTEFSGHCGVGDIDDDGFPDFAVANFLGAGGF